MGDIDSRDAIIRDLAQINADMVRTIAERFGNVMQATADVLRAADGAGLPRRQPPPPAPPPAQDDDDEADDGVPPSVRVAGPAARESASTGCQIRATGLDEYFRTVR
jgi:hypothetical protein